MQSIDLRETSAYGISKDLVTAKVETKMIDFHDIKNENMKKHPKCPSIPDHPCRILIIVGFGQGKINSLFNLINQQLDVDKIYLDGKDPYEAKYEFLINERESIGFKQYLNDFKAFIEYVSHIDDIE